MTDQTITIATAHGDPITVSNVDELKTNAEVRRQVGETIRNATVDGARRRSRLPDSPEAFDGASLSEPYPVPIMLYDFEAAPDLERLSDLIFEEFDGSRLVDDLHWHVKDASIRYAWKKKGGSSSGKLVLGKCVKLSGAARFFARQADFLIWLAADHCRTMGFTHEQIVALLFHELSHIQKQVDEDSGEISFSVRGHDIEAFLSEIELFGLWRDDLERAGETFRQIGLFDEEGE